MQLRTALLVGGLTAVSLVGLRAQGPPSADTNQDPMYLAIRSGDTARVTALIGAGNRAAVVNAKDRRGGATPLMHAAAVGSLDTLRVLLDRGADVNAKSAAGASALMWAATDLAKVQLLLDRGADVNAVSEAGRTALWLAAATDGAADVVRLLLARGANPHAVDSEKATTLYAATVGNDTDTIAQLVNAGVNVNTPNFMGSTPLMNAAMAGNVAAAKLLLAKGADVNAVSGPPGQQVKNGTIALGTFTPLLLASANGPLELVNVLLAAGADVNAKEARGMTPLMYAVATDHGDPAIVKALLARGANVRATTPQGETAADWARKVGNTALADVLAAGPASTPMAAHAVPAAAPLPLRPAVERGVALLERSADSFFVNSACGACHAQNITDIAAAAARRSGVAINEAALRQRTAGGAAAFGATASRLLERFDGPSVDILLYTLAAFAAAEHPADRGTDALAFNVAAQQWRDGRWHIGGVMRPPMADGDISRTALGVRALRVYGPPGRSDMAGRISRAVAWLQSATPITTEDHSYRLLGFAWGGADRGVIAAAARDLAAQQRPDGGWSQRDTLESDAYATGLALYALLDARSLPASDRTVQRAVSYLLNTQRADGSWFVRSRAPKFQPYFQGGFPYEHDQWISSMATGWSTAALAAALRGPDVAVRH